jgi:predicted DNA-binding transcriptional regulator YafY
LYGVEAERKSVSRDIQTLTDSGYSVLSAGKRQGYYLAEREFEDYELVMMSAAISRAKFITTKDSWNIIKKLRAAASPGIEKLLGETFADSSVKTDNIKAKYTVDKAVRAIKGNKKLSFKYIDYDESGQRKLRRGGHTYRVSPYYLAWVKDELFLIANPDSHEHLTHFKIAMMTDTELIDEGRRKRAEVKELAGQFDLGKYLRESVNMFTGEPIDVSIVCDSVLMSDLVNEFGSDIFTVKNSDGRISVTIRTTDSEGICRWVLQYGSRIEVISPESVRNSVKDALTSALDKYIK